MTQLSMLDGDNVQGIDEWIDEQAADIQKDATMRGTLAMPNDDGENPLIEVRERFAVTDLKGANWVYGKLLAARRYKADVQAFAALEVKKANDAENHYIDAYGEQIKRLVQDVTANVKQKYINVVGGRLQLRKSADNLEVVTEGALKEWVAKELPEALTHVIGMKIPGTTAPEMWADLDALCKKYNLQYTSDGKIAKAKVNDYFFKGIGGDGNGKGNLPNGCSLVPGKDELNL